MHRQKSGAAAVATAAAKYAVPPCKATYIVGGKHRLHVLGQDLAKGEGVVANLGIAPQDWSVLCIASNGAVVAALRAVRRRAAHTSTLRPSLPVFAIVLSEDAACMHARHLR